MSSPPNRYALRISRVNVGSPGSTSLSHSSTSVSICPEELVVGNEPPTVVTRVSAPPGPVTVYEIASRSPRLAGLTIAIHRFVGSR